MEEVAHHHPTHLRNGWPGRILIVGALPPPVTGAASITRAVQQFLVAEGAPATAIPTARQSRDFSRCSRILRPLWVTRSLIRFTFLLATSRQPMVYLSLSGGFAQAYEGLFLLVTRLFRVRVAIHHHSFRYLDRESIVFRMILLFAPPDTIHLCLGKAMQRLLTDQYGNQRKTIVISNLAFVPEKAESRLSGTMKAVGYLSNLSFAKGLKTVVRLAKALQDCESKIKVVIAGGFANRETETWFAENTTELHNLEHRGALHGPDKEAFWSGIDAFVFPTEYSNEAEPLVIIEAATVGIPTISTNRGCIKEMLPDHEGLVIDNPDQFVPSATTSLTLWNTDPREYLRVAKVISEHHAGRLAAARKQRLEFAEYFTP